KEVGSAETEYLNAQLLFTSKMQKTMRQ
ncbi:MAG: hypothetical protein RLZZ143_1749, partial [Cyanobacteriota bacterium]